MASHHPVILDVLSKATSQNPNFIKLAEQQLKILEVEAGYYPSLMAVVLDRSLEVNIRWLAAVCLKNGIDRYWRKTAPNAIAIEERVGLKQKFLLCFDEPENIVAAQIAVTVSKVARLDFPSDWPELFPAIINVIQWPEDLHQQRGLLVLHHVVKTLASKRLIGDQQVFQQMTASLFPSLFQLWTNHSSAFLQEAHNANINHKLLLEKCVFCLKVLRKLVVYGFKYPSKELDAVNFISVIFQQFKPFIEYRKCIQLHETLCETTEKYLVLLTKVLAEVLEQHARFFVQFVRPTLECAVTFCFSQEYKDALFERLTINFLSLIKAIVTNEDYNLCKSSEREKNPELCKAEEIRNEFFTQPILQEMVQQILSKYFLLTESELQMWEEQPEEFAIEERGESWKFNLRPCAEVLLLSLLRKYKYLTVIRPMLVGMIKEIRNLKATDYESVLKKEAVLNCCGITCFDLHFEVDFSSFFCDYLVPELQETSNFILRRRIVWLMGQLVNYKISNELRPSFYEVVVQMLQPKENLLVRLSAANALKSSVDHLEFELDQFQPFLEGIFGNLFQLLKDVRECDLKMLVLHVMTFLVERIGRKISQHVHSLISYLIDLWESCGDHMMLRCSIISCLAELVYSLGAGSMVLHLHLVPMIAFSTDVNLPGHVYLLEDALHLWLYVVQNATSCTPELLDVAKNLMGLFESSREVFMTSLDIMIGYILLSPNEFLQRYGAIIVQTFLHVLSDLVPEAVSNLMSSVDTVLVVFPTEGADLFKPVIAASLSMVFDDEGCSYDLSVYLAVLSRIILHNQSCFASLLQQKALETNQEVEKVFGTLLDIWLVKMPCVPLIETQKLLALALLCLLTTNSSVVLDRISGIILAVVETLNDVTGVNKAYCYTNPSNDLLIIDESSLQEEEDDDDRTEHEKREMRFKLKDPKYTVVLRDYLKSQMSVLEQLVGHTKFEDLMSTVDSETMEQLKKYLLD